MLSAGSDVIVAQTPRIPALAISALQVLVGRSGFRPSLDRNSHFKAACHKTIMQTCIFPQWRIPMQITISDNAGSTAKIGLVGKLDIAGADVIAMPLAALAGSKKV